MGSQLNHLVKKALLTHGSFQGYDPETATEETVHLYELVKEDLILKVKKEVEEEIRVAAMEAARKDIEHAKVLSRIKGVKSLTISGVLLAFIVGLSVNQFTNWIDCIRSFMGFKKASFSIFLFLLMSLVSAVILLVLVFRQIGHTGDEE